MRTADKIIRDYMGWSDTEVGYAEGFGRDVVAKIINEARKEAIEECIERVWSMEEECSYGSVENILNSLINELK